MTTTTPKRRVTEWLDHRDPFLEKYKSELEKRGYQTIIIHQNGKSAIHRSEHKNKTAAK